MAEIGDLLKRIHFAELRVLEIFVHFESLVVERSSYHELELFEICGESIEAKDVSVDFSGESV